MTTAASFPVDVACITLDNPPVNSLGHALRNRIAAALEAAESNPAIRAIVLMGSQKAFSAGADVTEFGTPLQGAEPILRSVIAQVERCRKPVVAAIAGVALGGGLELALGCNARVALESASIGLPEVQLGLIPGSGGTQRLPRLIGVEAALSLMSSGQAQPAVKLSSLFERVVPTDLIPAACTVALALADARAPWPRARDVRLDPASVHSAVDAARNRLNARQRQQPAYAALLDAVAACSLPFDDGLQRERELFMRLVPSPAAQALRYQFKAEREAVRLPEALKAEPRSFQTIGIIGAGTMGTGIAISAIEAGLDVLLVEQDREALDRGQQRIAMHYESRVESGKMNVSVAAATQARLTPTIDWARLAEADLIVEAVFEDLEVKQAVFGRLDKVARPGAILATNTSYLDVDAIANATTRPQDVLGLHFFSPANVMKLLEVVRGRATSPDVLATGMTFGRGLRKMPVLCGNAFGFIGNRVYNAYRRQCEFMLEDGAWPEDVDRALTGMGFAMGPFAVADLSGLDIAWRMRKAQAAKRDPRERYVTILDALCEQGRLGRKTGAGYYAYAEGRQVPKSDAEVRQVIEQASAARGLVRQPLSAPDICRRALLAMVNEAALLRAEGVALRANDIDVVLVQGYGFPRWEGGPVFWARQQAQRQLEADLDQLIAQAGFGAVRASPAQLEALLA